MSHLRWMLTIALCSAWLTRTADAVPLPLEPLAEHHVERCGLPDLSGEWTTGSVTYRVRQIGVALWIDGQHYRVVGHVRNDGRIVVYWQHIAGFMPSVYVLVNGELVGSWDWYPRVEVHDGVLVGGGSYDRMSRVKGVR